MTSHHGYKERLSVADAAKLLDITSEAIRQRMRRGSIRYEKDESGKYYVYVSPTEGVENNEHNNTNADYSALRDHIVTPKCELQRFSVWLTRLTSATHEAYSERLRQTFMKPWFGWVNIIANHYSGGLLE